jgi:hypothetical protein
MQTLLDGMKPNRCNGLAASEGNSGKGVKGGSRKCSASAFVVLGGGGLELAAPVGGRWIENWAAASRWSVECSPVSDSQNGNLGFHPLGCKLRVLRCLEDFGGRCT